MKKLLILAGTTEGRLLSDKLEKAGIKHIVSVASEYGETMLEEAEARTVRIGRLDENAMAAFLKSEGFTKGDLLVDATHPYAREVSENARNVAGQMELTLLRVARDRSDIPVSDRVRIYSSIEQCALELKDVKEPVLLTTGSNNLEIYADILSEETLKKTYVRVIPSLESIEKCKAHGFEESHIIALQGPFGVELNEALIKQYGIKHLVTKESGKAGGFSEKLEAAERCGISIYVIARPEQEDGLELGEVERLILSEFHVEEKSEAEIILAGAGMGDKNSMTEEVIEAVKSADAVFGAGRLLNGLSAVTGVSEKAVYDMYRAEDILEVITAHPDYKKVVVLFSVFFSFYSGAKAFIRSTDHKVSVLPGISSVSFLAARLGVSYEDAGIYSLHGRFSRENLNEILWNIRYREKAFILFSGAEDVSALAHGMKEWGIDAGLMLGINLASHNEEIIKLSISEVERFEKNGSIIGFIHNMAPGRRPLIPYFYDEDFVRDNTPITKEVIRHESIRRLNLREGDLVFDIGGGTGSVAIEMASLHPSLRVVTMEKKKERVEILKQNIEKHKAGNIKVLEGDAAELLRNGLGSAMDGRTKPDAVFIGGSGGELSEIISLISEMGKGTRFVINAVTMETIKEIGTVLDRFAPKKWEAVQIGVSNLTEVGDYHMFRSENPIMIYSFEL